MMKNILLVKMEASECATKELLDLCYEGEAEKVIQVINENPKMINTFNDEIVNPLMKSIRGENDWELTRWLINHPDLLHYSSDIYESSLAHYAVNSYMPFDIFINLIDVCLDKTVFDEEQGNLKMINNFNEYNYSPLDDAGFRNRKPFLLYLCSIGAQYWKMDKEWRNCVFTELGEVQLRFQNVTIETWLALGLVDEAYLWCIAANDYSGFKRLMKIKEISKMDTRQLKAVAKLFNRQRIRQLWGEFPKLQNLVYEQVYHDWKIQKLDRIFGWTLPELGAHSYHETICKILKIE